MKMGAAERATSSMILKSRCVVRACSEVQFCSVRHRSEVQAKGANFGAQGKETGLIQGRSSECAWLRVGSRNR